MMVSNGVTLLFIVQIFFNSYCKINKLKGGIKQSGFVKFFRVGNAFINSYYLVKFVYCLYRKELFFGMRCVIY